MVPNESPCSIQEQEDQEDLLDKGDIAEFFEFGSGIFAAILLALIINRVQGR